MRVRWKLFLAQLAALTVVLVTVLLAVRSVAIQAINHHMDPMTAGLMEHLTLALREAVTLGLNEAVIAGALAAIAAASLASLGIASLLTRPIRRAAKAAEQIACGNYAQRLSYDGRDEIGEFARSFNNMAERLEETETLRRELLATISHELRTPLSNIQGYMEGLVEGVIPEEPRTYKLVHGEALRLARLVGDIERLSRLESGIEHLEFQALDATEGLRKVVEAMRPRFDRDGITLTIEAVENAPRVWADEDKLSQILVNLLTNALAHTPKGGSVTVGVLLQAQGVLFQVADTGEGIPAADLPRVFERFYRVDKSRSSAGGGTGIGLAVVKVLVERMGGTVSAESQVGEGTTVSFTLRSARQRHEPVAV